MDKLSIQNLAERLSWERPERTDQAGQLLIVGGPSTELKWVDSAFRAVKLLGAGKVVAAVPETIARVFSRGHEYLEAVGYEAGFKLSEQGLRKINSAFTESEAILILGVGRNLDNQRRLAEIIGRLVKPCVIDAARNKDCLEMLLSFGDRIMINNKVSVVINMAGLQKMIVRLNLLSSNSPVLKSTSGWSEVLRVLEIVNSQYNATFVFEGEISLVADNNRSVYHKVNLPEYQNEAIAARYLIWNLWLGLGRELEAFFMATSDR